MAQNSQLSQCFSMKIGTKFMIHQVSFLGNRWAKRSAERILCDPKAKRKFVLSHIFVNDKKKHDLVEPHPDSILWPEQYFPLYFFP